MENNKIKIGNVTVRVWASHVGCKCQPMAGMEDTNEFTLATDYDGRYHATCKHCGEEIKLFKDPKPYFQDVKMGAIVYDTRFNFGEVAGYDHFMSSLTVNFNDDKHHSYDFNGLDYRKDNDGEQHLFYGHVRRKGDK